MTYYIYILRTSSNTLYIGQTNNLAKRLKEHKNKSPKSAKYLRYFTSFKLVYSEKYSTRTEAMQREAQLKKWPKAKKQALINGDKKINVKVKTGKSENKVVKKDSGDYEVWVKTRPIKGLANKEFIKTLSKHLNLKPYNLRIVKGLTSTIKVVEIIK